MSGEIARPTFDQINIIASDMDSTLAFYRLLGLEVPDAWRGDHASAQAGDSVDMDFDSPAFAQAWNQGWKGRVDLAGRVVLGFRVASSETVDERYAALTTAGHSGLQPPFDAFWGARYAIVEGPDGIAVGIMGPQDSAKRTPPPKV
jgi:catechol 2,3-dioxygenase-like lactoylglutathione lyase family enzyme